MLNYKILMLDLDGTLVHKFNKIEKQTGLALQQFVKDGGIIMFNTGRSLLSSLKIKEILKKKYKVAPSIISCFNGSIIYDCIDNKIVEYHTISKEHVHLIGNICKSLNLKMGIYDGNNSTKESLVLGNFKASTIKFLNLLNKKFRFVKYDENKNYESVYKILFFSSINKKKSNKVSSQVRQKLTKLNDNEDIINHAQPVSFLYEITSCYANKGKAISVMIDALNKHGYNYSFRDVCAIGDSDNDLPMFGDDAINNPTVGLALALDLKLNETHKISNEANKTLKKPHLLAKFIKKFVFKSN